MSASPSMRAVADRLAERTEELAMLLVGEAPTFRRRGELRFRRKGSLVVFTAGPRRGTWFDHDPPGNGRPPGPGGAAGGDALDLVAHLRGCGRGEALAWALAWLGEEMPPRPWRSGPETKLSALERRADGGTAPATLDLARQLWREGVTAEGSPVATYLRGRELELPWDAPLRFHPNAWRNRQYGPPGPAMLALMTDPVTNEPTGVHVTYLGPGGRGKATGERPKIMLGRVGVVRLVPDEEVTLGLGIAEGIETSLAVMQRFDWRPVWAACSAGGITAFPVLRGIECLTVFADADGRGMTAARECCERWSVAGVEARLIAPPAGDWNDGVPPRAERSK